MKNTLVLCCCTFSEMLVDSQHLFALKYCICLPLYYHSTPSCISVIFCTSFVSNLLQVAKLLTRPIFQLLLALPVLERMLPLLRFSPLTVPPLIGQSMLNRKTWLPLETFHIINWRDQWPFWMSLLTSSR